MSAEYVKEFSEIQGLTWTPWVGARFPELPANRRLLVVGESHYYNEDIPKQTCKAYEDEKGSTIEMIQDCHGEETTRTLTNLRKLFFGEACVDRAEFWSHTAYYNFVQRPMNHNRGGQPERPKGDDLVKGRSVFEEVVRTLRPSHCVFMGVGTAGAFGGSVSCTARVGRTWARGGKFEARGFTAELAFIQHPGRYFSWRKWRGYLQAQHPGLMSWLGAHKDLH